MKISKLFNLSKSQYELDFVDIDPQVDTTLFLDPYFISKCDFSFAVEAHHTIQSYFEYLLALLKEKKMRQAEEMFSYLGESNDICLGMSQNEPHGKGMGPEDTKKIFKELLRSGAVESGIMEDIEDFRIFVKNVDKDKVSDMTANIIKWNLLNYTKEQCLLHNIPLTHDVPSGMYWDSRNLLWSNCYTDRLIIDNKPILLVPKRIVSFTDKYTSKEFKQHFVLNYLQHENLRLQTSLVQRRKDGRQYVTKKSVEAKEGKMSKNYLVKFTELHPQVFSEFKKATLNKLSHVSGAVLENINVYEVCDFLSKKLDSIPTGTQFASKYHDTVIGILELLFYPNLSNPKKEKEIHEGRKRIDIVFENSSEEGFFYRVPNQNINLPCPYVYVECKNYTGKVSNPELDQLSGRFSNRRGRIGILVCRNLDDNNAFMKRCADTFIDDRGLIIPITDEDLKQALKDFPTMESGALERILFEKYEKLVFDR